MGTFGLIAWMRPGRLMGTMMSNVTSARQLTPP